MKFKYNFLIIPILLATITSHVIGADFIDESSQFFQKIWGKFSSVCNDAAEYITDDDRNSKTALEFFTMREPKYVRLLHEAQDILGNSEATDEFEAIEKLRSKNRQLDEKIIELKRKRISAPDSSYNPLADTKSRIDKKLKKIPQEIAENDLFISDLRARVLQKLNQQGMNLSDEELNYFLISAEGDELIRLMTIAENMKRIQRVIEKELQSDPNNVNMARIYTGMYLVSLDAYSDAHDNAIKKISGYREKLKGISSEAVKNYNEAKKIRKSVAESDKANAEANININERTMQIAKMYDGILQRRNQNLAQSKENLKKKIDLARNTYKTIVNGSSLIALVNSGSNEYALLINFEMPELKTLYDGVMINAFAQLSEKIKNED